MEVTFCCENGQQKCSRWVLEFSDFFNKKAQGCERLNNELKFDYKMFAQETIKVFLDLVHGIAIANLKRWDVLSLIKFLTFEGKTGSSELITVNILYNFSNKNFSLQRGIRFGDEIVSKLGRQAFS